MNTDMEPEVEKRFMVIAKRSYGTMEGFFATDGRTIEPSASSSEEGTGFRLHILMIALGQAAEGKWYVGTQQLQLASFEVCVACRRTRTLRVTVERAMPLSLWGGDDDSMGDSTEAPGRRRVPALRAAGVSWMIPGGMIVPILSEAVLVREVEWVQVTGVDCIRLESNPTALARLCALWKSDTRVVHSPRSYFEAVRTVLDEADDRFCGMQCLPVGVYRVIDAVQYMGSVPWPSALRQLSIGCLSHERVDFVALPKSLERLHLGGCFKQPIESGSLPVALRQLTLGGYFNQSIVDVVWPAGLLELALGDSFGQPIADVAWPAGLRELTFGDAFDQAITDVVWPKGLLQLTFGGGFNQPITGVVWPVCLLQLTFGDRFDQAITDVVWPACLMQLTFGKRFDQPITDVTWSPHLARLALGDRFDQPITEVVWPEFLRILQFGNRFNQPIREVAWPSHLWSLEFGREFDQPLEGIMWPSSLRSIVFHVRIYKQVEALEWPHFLYPEFTDDAYERGLFECPPDIDIFDKPTTIQVEYLDLYKWDNSFSIEEG